jgi:DNA-binding ferritin-like protein
MKECHICQITHRATVPCVHSNGTSAKELLAQLDAVFDAIRELIRAMGNASPNGRDYYPTGTTQQAIKEHCLRAEKLNEILAEYSQMRDHVQECINLKERR